MIYGDWQEQQNRTYISVGDGLLSQNEGWHQKY